MVIENRMHTSWDFIPACVRFSFLLDKSFSFHYNDHTVIPPWVGNPVEVVFGIGSVTEIMADQKKRWHGRLFADAMARCWRMPGAFLFAGYLFSQVGFTHHEGLPDYVGADMIRPNAGLSCCWSYPNMVGIVCFGRMISAPTSQNRTNEGNPARLNSYIL